MNLLKSLLNTTDRHYTASYHFTGKAINALLDIPLLSKDERDTIARVIAHSNSKQDYATVVCMYNRYKVAYNLPTIEYAAR